MMNYYSTNRKSRAVDFREAVYRGLPSDRGLYFPEVIPELGHLANSGEVSLQEVALEVMRPFCDPVIPGNELEGIIHSVLDFDIPIVDVEPGISALELFHGPTYAFKDVGARFLARCLSYFNEQEKRELTILVATSGDTGGAVASGFHNVPGVKVVILYPSGKVSELQEKQLTTLGGNISALEIDGSFDDCQALVKEAFLDGDLSSKRHLSSANSINIARWITQSIYFFWTSIKLNDDLVFSVPSGNYGNLAAGLLAKKMGAKIEGFIAASNANDVVPRFLETGSYDPRPTVHTYSNAMDVGNPSNFSRILELYDQDYEGIKGDVTGNHLTDDETLSTMQELYSSQGYLLDPHGAIGYASLKRLRKSGSGVFLATAHPCKFMNVVQRVVNDYKLPPFASSLMRKKQQSEQLSSSFSDLKSWLLG